MKEILAIVFFCMTTMALWRGEIIDQKEVVRRWGQQDFTAGAFKDGSIDRRASMAADLLKKQNQFHGKKVTEIRRLLGDFSGHYFSESYPTYLIQKGDEAKPESWQLVFLIDRENKVKEVVVHKNCCY